ncbi:MAG: dTMP kinase [Candidatus Aenigmarchaeota archaeon]|nr:dTMP kinase [Candidatus Aenigmarchaeota archaeon]
MFFVLEGLDGSGITTQAHLLKNYLAKKALLTKEPSDGLIGGLIKSCLRKEWSTSPLALQMLFAADRAHHLESEIEPALKQGKIVISDRYMLSTYAFGAVGVDIATIKAINASFRKPDATIFIDTPPDVCVTRMSESRQHVELFEELDKLRKIRENYIRYIGEFPDAHIIDGNRPMEEVHEDVKKALKL